jgi:hydrogenase-4 membrane subunit HyfE
MRLPLILFLLAAVVPVFFGKIRSAPFWLSLQAFALAWNGAAHHTGWTVHTVVALVETITVRAVIAPLLLRRAIRLRSEPNTDLMPSNLFTWAIGVALIVLAFDFGGAAMDDVPALALGVVGGMVAIALLLLSTNLSPPGQLVAVLFMENGIAVFESLLPEPWAWPVHGALTAVYLVTVGVGGWLIGTPTGHAPVAAGPVPGDAS